MEKTGKRAEKRSSQNIQDSSVEKPSHMMYNIPIMSKGGGHSGAAARQRGQDGQLCDGGHAHRQGAGPLPGQAAGRPLQHGSGGERLFHGQPNSPGIFRRGVRLRHRRMFYSGVQRVSGEKRETGGFALRRQFSHGGRPAHRGPHPGGDGIPRTLRGPLRRLLRPPDRGPGRLADPGDVSHRPLLRRGLLSGGSAPGPGPFYRPRPHVGGVQPGDYRLLFYPGRRAGHLRTGGGLSAGLVFAGGHPPASLAQTEQPSAARPGGAVGGNEKGAAPHGAGDGVHLGAAHHSGHQLPVRLPTV